MNVVLELRQEAGLSQAELEARSGVARPRPSEALAAHRDQVLALLAEHNMTAPRVFGSAARGGDRPGSDLDLVVDLAPTGELLDLIDGAAALEELLGVPVDLVTSRSLRPDHEIARTAVPL